LALVEVLPELFERLRGLRLAESVGRAFSVGRVDRSRLPYGNFGCPRQPPSLQTHWSLLMILGMARGVKKKASLRPIAVNTLSLPSFLAAAPVSQAPPACSSHIGSVDPYALKIPARRSACFFSALRPGLHSPPLSIRGMAPPRPAGMAPFAAAANTLGTVPLNSGTSSSSGERILIV
jgi:hypothetical protein